MRNRRDPDGFKIYRHVCRSSGKCYIGQTAYGVERRWKQHCMAALDGGVLLIHKAIRKYGADDFDHDVLEILATRDEANVAESRWIAFYRSNETGYNLDSGGSASCRHQTTKDKIGTFHQARLAKMSDEERSALGHKVNSALSPVDRREKMLAHWASLPESEKAAQVFRLNSSRNPESRSRSMKKMMDAVGPDQRRQWAKDRESARSPERQSEIRRKGWETRRAKVAV